MLKKTEKDGYIYISPKTNKQYDLLEGVSLGGKTTSDIVFIFDFKTDVNADLYGKVVGFFYGATTTEEKGLEEIVTEYIKSYEDWQ